MFNSLVVPLSGKGTVGGYQRRRFYPQHLQGESALRHWEIVHYLVELRHLDARLGTLCLRLCGERRQFVTSSWLSPRYPIKKSGPQAES